MNPETGVTLWELKSIDSSGSAKWCPTDNYLIASIDFFRLEDSARKELLKSYIYRIDPITGKSDSMELSRKGVQGMACIGNNLWVQTIDGHLLCIDLAFLRETKDIKINHSFSELSKTVLSWDGPVQLTRSKLLLALYSEFSIDAPTKIEYILYDIENDQQTVVSEAAPEDPTIAPRVAVINGSLITQDSNLIQCLDPNTLKPLWWINSKDEGKNAHVAWLDWRGVLVISDDAVACYGPPK